MKVNKILLVLGALGIAGMALYMWKKHTDRERQRLAALHAEAETQTLGYAGDYSQLPTDQQITTTQTASNINAGSSAYGWNTGNTYTLNQ